MKPTLVRRLKFVSQQSHLFNLQSFLSLFCELVKKKLWHSVKYLNYFRIVGLALESVEVNNESVKMNLNWQGTDSTALNGFQLQQMYIRCFQALTEITKWFDLYPTSFGGQTFCIISPDGLHSNTYIYLNLAELYLGRKNRSFGKKERGHSGQRAKSHSQYSRLQCPPFTIPTSTFFAACGIFSNNPCKSKAQKSLEYMNKL